jgi:hypothetical protein
MLPPLVAASRFGLESINCSRERNIHVMFWGEQLTVAAVAAWLFTAARELGQLRTFRYRPANSGRGYDRGTVAGHKSQLCNRYPLKSAPIFSQFTCTPIRLGSRVHARVSSEVIVVARSPNHPVQDNRIGAMGSPGKMVAGSNQCVPRCLARPDNEANQFDFFRHKLGITDSVNRRAI